MKFVELLKLARLSALPIEESKKAELRVREREIGFFGGLVFLPTILLMSFMEVPTALFKGIVVLSMSGYVVFAVNGLAQYVLLGLTVAAAYSVSYLTENGNPDLSTAIVFLSLLMIILGSCYAGRLQFVRRCAESLRSWPNDRS